jgi:hypothetical protein
MAFFGVNNTGITLGKFLEAGITVALTETLVGFPVAMNTENSTGVLQPDGFLKVLV